MGRLEHFHRPRRDGDEHVRLQLLPRDQAGKRIGSLADALKLAPIRLVERGSEEAVHDNAHRARVSDPNGFPGNGRRQGSRQQKQARHDNAHAFPPER
jgi:hypothetical protein